MIISDSPKNFQALISKLQNDPIELAKWIRSNVKSNFAENSNLQQIEETFIKYQNLNQQDDLASIVDSSFKYNVVQQAAKLGFDRFLEKCQNKLSPELINFQAPAGNTALHLAALEGETDTVEFLLEEGANPNLLNRQQKAPIHFAAVFHNTKMAEKKNCLSLLLTQTNIKTLASVDNTGKTLLLSCVNFDEPELISAILKKCPETIHSVDRRGQNILHNALIEKKKKLIEYLLNHEDADSLISEQTMNYSTALILACRYENTTETIAKLLESPACLKGIDKVDEHGNSALQWSFQNHNAEVGDLLIERGAQHPGNGIKP